MTNASQPQESKPIVSTDGDADARRLLPLLIVLGIVGLVCIGPTISSYGHLSYAYLRSIFFDGDLNILNEAQQIDEGWPEGVTLEPNRQTGLPSSPAAPGPSLFWTPFFSAAHIVVRGLDKLGFTILPDGYNNFYYLGINIGTFFYLALGCALLVMALGRITHGVQSVILVMTACLASPLLMAGLLDGSLPDSLSFFGASFFLFEWTEYRREPRIRNAVMLGTSAGILCLIRPLNLVLCVWPAVDMVRRGRSSGGNAYWECLMYLLALLFGMTPQLFVWYVQHGVPWPAPENRPEFTIDPLRFIRYLVSWPSGLLLRYPLFALGFAGLVFYIRKERQFALLLLLCLCSAVLMAGTMEAPWVPPEYAPRIAIAGLPFAVCGVAVLLRSGRGFPSVFVFVASLILIGWTVYCDLIRELVPIPETAAMLPKMAFRSSYSLGGFGTIAAVFLVVGVLICLFMTRRFFRELADPAADLPLSNPIRRIWIWGIVILLTDLLVGVSNWSHHEILLAVPEKSGKLELVPYAYNRYGYFKQVGLELELGPGASKTLPISSSYAVSGLYVVTRVSQIRDIAYGTPIARFSVQQRDHTESVLIEFGQETVPVPHLESSSPMQDTANVYQWKDPEEGIVEGCSCRLDLSRPVIAEQLKIENLVADATVTVEGIGFRSSRIIVVPADRIREMSEE